MMRMLAMLAGALLQATVPPPAPQDAPGAAEKRLVSGVTQSCSIRPAPVSIPGTTSVVYKRIGARELRLHLIEPAGRRGNQPAILFFFGGGWRTGDATAFLDQAKAFAAHGYVAALADYRVFCRDRATAADGVDDADAAYAWLRAHHADYRIDPRRIVLSGGSAGGLLAAAAAQRAPADAPPWGLILFNPAVDVRPVAPRFGLTAAQASAISPAALPLRQLPPTIIFHGKADTTVPIAGVRAFCQAASATGRRCTMVEYEGQKHGFFHSKTIDPLIGTSPYESTLAKALAFAAALPGGIAR